jgi:hypothetical protein
MGVAPKRLAWFVLLAILMPLGLVRLLHMQKPCPLCGTLCARARLGAWGWGQVPGAKRVEGFFVANHIPSPGPSVSSSCERSHKSQYRARGFSSLAAPPPKGFSKCPFCNAFRNCFGAKAEGATRAPSSQSPPQRPIRREGTSEGGPDQLKEGAERRGLMIFRFPAHKT